MTDAVQAALIGAFVGATIGALGGLLTTVINNRSAQNRRKAEDRKWYADHFLSRKIDALSTLYSSLVHAKGAVEQYLRFIPPPFTVEQFNRDLGDLLDRYAADFALAWVYLDEEDREMLSWVGMQFETAQRTILITIGGRKSYPKVEESDRQALDVAYDSAVDRMQKILSPDVLKGIEPDE